MSYTNSTTHYGIPLPTETDLVNGLDWNTSSELIDSAIYEASEAAGTASRDITAIKSTIANLQDADVHFQQDLNEATGRIATLEQNATKDEEDIQDIADMITDKVVTQAQSDVHVDVGEWFRYNGVLYVCTTEINIDDTIIPNTNCRATNIEDEMPSAGESVIDDSTTSADKTWSSQKISTPVAGNTRYDIQTGKMQYYDGAAWQDAPQGGVDSMVNFAKKLYHFDSTHLSFTANEDVYLFGCAGIAGDNLPSKIEFTYDGDTSEVTFKATTTSPMIFNQFAQVIKAGTVITIINGSPVMSNTALEVFALHQ